MGEIKLDAHNYRKHDERNLKLIKRSLKNLGAGRSILIDADGEIIAGNATFKTAQELGIPVEVIKTDGTKVVALQRTDLHTQDRKRKEMALMDNTTSDKPNWDYDEISTDFSADELPELGLEDLPNFTADNAEVVEDEVPSDEEVETRCKPGDIWQLGEHRLMCGDSTVITDVEKLMAGEKADMVFTDPPYNVNYSGRGEQNKLGPIKNDNMDDSKFEEFCNDFFESYFFALKPLGCIYVCHPDSQSAPKIAFETNFAKFFKKSSTIIWIKQSAGMGWQDYRSQHEPILYGWKEGDGKHAFYGDRTNTTVWDIKRDSVSEYVHPTQKPVAIPAKAIKNSSKTNDLIVDLFGGSGSTLIACEQLNRKCYSMELDEHYCDVIIKRWENLTGREAKLCK